MFFTTIEKYGSTQNDYRKAELEPKIKNGFLVVCFLSITIYNRYLLLRIFSVRQFFSGVDSDSVAALVISVALLVAATIWTRGMLELINASFSLEFEDGLMIWKEKSVIGIKVKKITLEQISKTGWEGDVKVGLSLIVFTSGNKYRLGSLMSVESLNQISDTIDEHRSSVQEMKKNCTTI